MTAIGRKLTASSKVVASLKVLAISTVLILALSLAAQPAYAQGQVHVVQAGETLFSIATRYGTTPQAIAAANNLANAN
jgi:LysM repeat protein